MLDHSDRLSAVFSALADRNRRTIVEVLSHGDAPVGRLAERLPVTLAATLQHVQVLSDAGLVETEKLGRTRVCRLAPQSLAPVRRWIDAREAFWNDQIDDLDDYLNHADPKGTH